MNQPLTCCKEAVASHPAIPSKDLFSTMIVIDYYDGPIAGFLVCKLCQSHYYYYMLDWNADHSVRIFALAPVTATLFPKLYTLFQGHPTSLIWIPPVLAHRPSEEQIDELYASGLQEAIDSAGVVELVVGWSIVESKPISIRRVTTSLTQHLRSWFDLETLSDLFDWFSFLSIGKT